MMDIKLAKFAPLALGGLFAFRELLTLVITYRFDVLYYLFSGDGLYFGPDQIILFFVFLLKIAFVLGLLYEFKLYTISKISQVKLVAGALVGLYFLRALVSTLMVGRWDAGFIRLLGVLVFLLVIANLVIALTAKDPSAPQKPRQQAPYQPPVQMAQPVQYRQQPVQNFGAQPGQSIPDQLAALQALVEAGTLTQAEFKAAKQRIIGG
jgi:hypothetical protein